MPACDAMLMIRPPPAAFMCFITRWLMKNVDLTLRSSVRSKSASVVSSAQASTPPPTLLTRMSMRPSSAIAVSIAA